MGALTLQRIMREHIAGRVAIGSVLTQHNSVLGTSADLHRLPTIHLQRHQGQQILDISKKVLKAVTHIQGYVSPVPRQMS